MFIRKIYPVLLLVLILLSVQCKREPLQIHPVITPLSDFESHDGSIHLNISGGKPPYAVQWSIPSADSVLDGLAAGIFIVTITDKKGKTLTDTIEVTQPQWYKCIDSEGTSYKTRKIGTQIWMVENLRAKVTSRGDTIQGISIPDSLNADLLYGRLYSWKVAMNQSTSSGSQGICPDGWHLPSDKEWKTLTDSIEKMAVKLPDFNIELSLQFAGFFNGEFQNKDVSVSFWTSDQAHDNAWKRYFHKDLSKAFRYHEKQDIAISVRCVKDSTP